MKYSYKCYGCQNEPSHGGSIPLNIHEVWSRLFWGEAYRGKIIPLDNFIGHIPLLYKKLIKNQNQECLNISCPKLEKTVLNFLGHPL